MARRFRLPRSIEELSQWYAHYVSPLSLVAGFLADNLFLAKRVDLLLTNALLGTYLVVSAAAIILLNVIQAGRVRHLAAVSALPILPVVVQFCFGGLFSAYLSLYSRSASIAVSWVFVGAIALLVLLNERFSHFYSRFFVQVSIYFTTLFSFLIFFLPVLFRRIGPAMFLASGLAALGVMTLLLALLFTAAPPAAGRIKRTSFAIGGIFLLFNALYFTNAIPPLPLSLRAGGVYHQVARLPDGSYFVVGETVPWYEEFLNYAPVYHIKPGEPAYAFSAVFAPSGLSTMLLHRWQRYDLMKRQWVTESVIRFPMEGGRDGGYRGYSEKTNVAPGAWRVDVVTPYGQIIGRISFTIEASSTTPPLVRFVE